MKILTLSWFRVGLYWSCKQTIIRIWVNVPPPPCSRIRAHITQSDIQELTNLLISTELTLRYIRAVYTCIKKRESFIHSGFSWEVARQLPLNTAKNPNRKTHLRSRIFWNSAGFSGVFANVNACSNLAGYYSGFWSCGTWPSAESPDRGPRRNAHYTCTVKGREKSRMRTTYQNTSMRFGGFSRMRFSCQKTRMLWVFLAV